MTRYMSSISQRCWDLSSTVGEFLATHYESVQTMYLLYLNLHTIPLYTPIEAIQPDAEMIVMRGRGHIMRYPIEDSRFCQLYDR